MKKLLTCKIISHWVWWVDYTVCDWDEVITHWTASSESWARHDAWWGHTKESFDKKYPEWWEVKFDF